MTMNTLTMEPITSELDWLLIYINEHVDWKNPFRNEEFNKLKAYVAEATMQPLDCVTVPKDTDGGKLYHKLRHMAKEERLDSIVADIQFIRIERFGNLSKERGTELAALVYAKQVHNERPVYAKTGPGGATFICSSPNRLDRALEQYDQFRKKIRTSLNKVTYV